MERRVDGGNTGRTDDLVPDLVELDPDLVDLIDLRDLQTVPSGPPPPPPPPTSDRKPEPREPLARRHPPAAAPGAAPGAASGAGPEAARPPAAPPAAVVSRPAAVAPDPRAQHVRVAPRETAERLVDVAPDLFEDHPRRPDRRLPHGPAPAEPPPPTPLDTPRTPLPGVLGAPPSAMAHRPQTRAHHQPSPCTRSSPVTTWEPPPPWWQRMAGLMATAALAATALAVLVVANTRGNGDAAGNDPSGEIARVLRSEPHTTVVAEARLPIVNVYEAPGKARPTLSLDHPTPLGGPLVFTVVEERGEWLRVQIPEASADPTGWIRRDEVTVSRHNYRLVVSLSGHRLQLWRGPDLELDVAVAVGTTDAPPPGTLYVTHLLETPAADGVYGDYAFALSGFPVRLDDLMKGRGFVGIHTAADPSVVGADVSTGSLGIAPDAMEELVGQIPLGTPVEVRP